MLRSDPVRSGSVPFCSVPFRSDRIGSVRIGSVRFGSVRFGSVRFGSVRFGSVRFGSVRFDLVQFIAFHFISPLSFRLADATLLSFLYFVFGHLRTISTVPQPPHTHRTLLKMLEIYSSSLANCCNNLPSTVSDRPRSPPLNQILLSIKGDRAVRTSMT